jgi:hypothetical protein
MPDFPSPADGAVPPAGDSPLDELLTAGQPPQDVAAGLQPVAAVLAALRAGPADGELAGQGRVLAEFRSTVRVSHRAGRSRARRPAPLRERLSSKLAVITAAAAVAVSGAAAAAYAGALPGPLQRAAHNVIAAPEAGAAHGRAAPAAVGARPLHSHSAVATPSPVTSLPGARHGHPGSARKHHKHKQHGRHGDHKGRGAAHPGMSGDRRDDGAAIRRDVNQMAYHKGSRLPLPLPRAAASRFRPYVPTGRGQAGAEPRVRVPTPGGPGPRSIHACGPLPRDAARHPQRSSGLVGSARSDRYPRSDDFVSWRLRLVRSMAPHC